MLEMPIVAGAGGGVGATAVASAPSVIAWLGAESSMAAENNAATDLVGCHSGPDVHDHPQVIIHAPNNPFGHTDEMWGEHGPGCNVLFGDGSLRFMGDGTSLTVLGQLATRDDGQPINGDY